MSGAPEDPGRYRRGPRPPQQARSRALLERVLSAAEELFGEGADDEVTMAAVAARAGVSVGALYRRFDGKEQLVDAVRTRILNRLDADLATALQHDTSDLATTIDTYVESVVRNVAAAANVFRQYVAQTRTELQPHDPVVNSLATAQRLLLDAAARHLDEVRRPDPVTALSVVARLVLGACVQRVLAIRRSPDGLTWAQWSGELADMAVLYLTHPRRRHRRMSDNTE